MHQQLSGRDEEPVHPERHYQQGTSGPEEVRELPAAGPADPRGLDLAVSHIVLEKSNYH